MLSVSTRLLNQLIGLKSEERPMTQEEIKMILHQSSEQGVIGQRGNGNDTRCIPLL
ncbi:hypothetical protein [Bacteroides acidifaciens]|uniref:hypothetical protein n=1 Tax=Bacteroides acidifaciens TaxID=85831 RepID=UPI003F68C90B